MFINSTFSGALEPFSNFFRVPNFETLTKRVKKWGITQSFKIIKVCQGFGQAQIGYGGFVLGSSRFSLLSQLPLKWRFLQKWSKVTQKTIISIRSVWIRDTLFRSIRPRVHCRVCLKEKLAFSLKCDLQQRRLCVWRRSCCIFGVIHFSLNFNWVLSVIFVAVF